MTHPGFCIKAEEVICRNGTREPLAVICNFTAPVDRALLVHSAGFHEALDQLLRVTRQMHEGYVVEADYQAAVAFAQLQIAKFQRDAHPEMSASPSLRAAGPTNSAGDSHE